tara:strand:- start:1424 stop:2596 length:1173 start_codon:yes stop_codon:yes gene_type:complete
MKQLPCLYTLLLFSCFQAFGQQTVHKKLNQLMLEESFSELNDVWPVLTNDDNFFVFDNGEYFMNRSKTEGPYAIMAQWENDLTSFSVRTSFMLGPVEKMSQSLGLILRASKDGQSAVICEINKFHRFRVRQLIDGQYKMLSTEGKDGWIKNSVVKGINEYNDVNIKTNGTDHDLYINGLLVYSFRIEGINAGSFGLFIGPETKGRVDFMSIYADELYRDKSKIYLTDDEVRELISDNEKLKLELEQSLDARALELENAIRILEKQLNTMRLINVQLNKENSEYAVIKSAVDTNQVSLLMDLSNKVIMNTLENRQLKIENKLITDSLSNVKLHFENLELELFQKVIDKKMEEQIFIDSILTKFCVVDTVFLPIDTLAVDSVSILKPILEKK